MKIASVADVKAHLSAYLKETEVGPVVVTRNGKAVAVLLAVRDDLELENLIIAHSPRLQAILETSRKQIREGQTVSHDDFWAEAGASKHGSQTPKPGKASGKGPVARRK
jgi:prevent-host-death family protein